MNKYSKDIKKLTNISNRATKNYIINHNQAGFTSGVQNSFNVRKPRMLLIYSTEKKPSFTILKDIDKSFDRIK